MTTAVDIANRALGQIKANTLVASLDERSKEAAICKLYYDSSRDTALQDFGWNFASRRVALATVTGTPPNRWGNVYRYPSDCVVARRIEDPTGAYSTLAGVLGDYVRPPFEVSSDASGMLILTDVASAVLYYTARVEDPNQWSPQFIDAMQYLLASQIAVQLTGNVDIAQSCYSLYTNVISSAKVNNLTEGSDYAVANMGAEQARN